jgi:hypothetical protein
MNCLCGEKIIIDGNMLCNDCLSVLVLTPKENICINCNKKDCTDRCTPDNWKPGVRSCKNFTDNKGLKYPTIRKTDNGMVVLFSEECVGTVVQEATTGKIFKLGSHMVNWEMKDFGCTVIPVHLCPNDCGNCKYELDPDENGEDTCHNCIEFSNWNSK